MPGNGQQDFGEAPSTQSLWQSTFGGIGGLFRMVNDPDMQRNAMLMMQAIAISAQSNARIEAKLDLVLKRQGYDHDEIERAIIARQGSILILDAAISPELRPSGNGGHPAASSALDHGSQGAARGAVDSQRSSVGTGGGDRAGDDGAVR